jgi:hypothetical protein
MMKEARGSEGGTEAWESAVEKFVERDVGGGWALVCQLVTGGRGGVLRTDGGEDWSVGRVER